MRLQLVIKSGVEEPKQELCRVYGRAEVTNQQIERIVKCEQVLEELLGYPVYIMPLTELDKPVFPDEMTNG